MSPTRMSKIESAIRVVIGFNKALNRHDIAGMMQYISDDCVFESSAPAPDGTVYSGKKEITQYWQDFLCESPRAQFKGEEVFGFGIRCVMRWRYDWEDAGGEKKHNRGVDIFQVKNELICKQFSYVKG